MEEKLNTLKIAITAAATAVGGFLGWQGILLIAWVVLMLIDYASGTLAAKAQGSWSSRAAREGIMHKGGMVLVVAVAAIADLVLCVVCGRLPIAWDWPMLLLLLVVTWYIFTEIGSIMENAGKMGAPIPGWFAAALDAGIRIVDQQGAQIADKITRDKQEQEVVDYE